LRFTLFPYTTLFRSVEQDLRSQNIGTEKFIRRRDTSINMRFGGEIDYRVGVFRERGENCLAIADVTFDEIMAAATETFQVVGISRIGKRVKVSNLARR